MNTTPTKPTQKIERGLLDISMHAAENAPAVRWQILDGLTPYEDAVARMEALADAIHKGDEPETVLLVEHPALYTAGTSANERDLVDVNKFPVHQTGRGGEYTYHGPGQRVAYVMLDLSRRRKDVRAFVAALEEWVISTLSDFNIKGERRDDRVGVWVIRPEKAPLAPNVPREDKIAAIGIRLRKWVSFHGISINVEPELNDYTGIVPCGIEGHGVTSLVDLGLPVTMDDLDIALKHNFHKIFGPTE
ncbi:MAG: lipoate-protein ligase B [Hyphomicrobiales bacterium]|nr:lipoyl(octanoyl) transferase LipB [Hyphomicrobiales bacterium]PCH50910.1 MAG: lipoate-protein ligase B [Hyphomicrobiales bacterium]